MADSQNAGDRPEPGGVDPTVRQADPSFSKDGAPEQGLAYYSSPGQGNPAPWPYPPQTRPDRTGWIIGGIFAVVVVLGIGVGIGMLAGGSGSSGTAGNPVAAPSIYSMDGVGNACDLVDTGPLKKWSSTPISAPEHREERPGPDGGGSLSCRIGYSTDGDPLQEARILLDVDFTNGSAPPYYEHWEKRETGKIGAGLSSGKVTGLGSEGYWHSEVTGDLVIDTSYIVCVLADNVTVHVQLQFVRDKDVSQVSRDNLDPIARAQVRATLDKLRKS
ncbi:hypothetical protein [Nocardia miyunensis]|uniref:hypothetical protein n=1 Tax=Nocardia miyunensis TaxID=282684 RepID=UPI00082EF366|nr:hypothetical protein [Nocardia miyunensis]